MKKIPLLACLCLAFISAFSQKVDLDKTSFTFEYRDLPLSPLGVKTYAVTVNAPNDFRALFGGASLEDMINIEGLKKLPSTEAQSFVDVTIRNLVVNKWKVEERVQVLTDNTGKETGRKSWYRVDVNYSCPFNVVVKNHQDAVVAESPVGAANYQWSSQEFATSKEATDYYSTNEGKIRTDLSLSQNRANFTTLSSWLTTNFGYKLQKVSDVLWILNSKKHPETQAQQEAASKFKAAIAKVTADNMPDDAKATLKEAISYFDAIPAKFATDEKNDKKMRYGAFYNKAKIYLYLDQPDAAIKEANALVANGYDEGDGKRLRKDAEALAEQLKTNKTDTRHFALDFKKTSLPAAPVSWADRNQKYRVHKITESRYDKAYGPNAHTVYENEYVYGDDGAITAIKRTDNGKPAEGYRFAYAQGEVTIKREKSKDAEKTFLFENNTIKDYKSNRSNTFSFAREGNRISKLVHDDRCNKMTTVYQYDYDDSGRIDKLAVTRKELGPKILEYYKAVYDAQGRVQNINRTSPNGTSITNQYSLERDGDRVTKIHYSLGGKPWERIEFGYDENGNIKEQRFIVIRGEKEERLERIISVAYEEAKGNDYILWDNNHWLFNSMMGIRSYVDIETPCY